MVASDDRYRILPVLFGLSLSDFCCYRSSLPANGWRGLTSSVAPENYTSITAGELRARRNRTTTERISERFSALGPGVQAAKPKSLDISSASTFGVTRTVQSAEDGGNRVEQLSLRLDL